MDAPPDPASRTTILVSSRGPEARLAALLVALACGVSAGAVGCGPRAVSTRVSTSSGRPGFAVECWDDPAVCDDEAQRDCRYGYALTSTSERIVAPGPDQRGGTRLRIVIECASDGAP
jgi:hypothetical protein